MKRSFPKVVALALACVLGVSPAAAQQPQPPASPQPAAVVVDSEEVLQVNTRVVFLDALVTDKKTRSLASDLKAENFEVVADGKPRPLAYFTREGDAARRPLALTLVFDLERLGAGRYMRRTEILEAMAAELSKLPPADEVAVVVLDPSGQDGRREWLTPFTRNRAQVASALAIIPTLVAAGAPGGGDGDATGSPLPAPADKPETAKEREDARVKEREDARVKEREDARAKEREDDNSVSVSVEGVSKTTITAPSVEAMKAQLEDLDKKSRRPGEEDEVDKFVDKKGRELTRTLKPDGTLLIQKINPKDGSVEVDIYGESDMPRAVFEVTKRTARERPNSQAAIVYVTDGITLMAYAEREYIEHKMLRQNVIFSALVTDMKTGFKLAKPLLAPLGNWAGLNIYGGAQHVAKESGGEVVRVRRPADYAEGLARIIGNLNARYSLGFTLADDERDDGRVHRLQIRARAKDAKGKERKLEVKSRTGYFTPAEARAKQKPEAAPKPDANAAAPEPRVKN
jgi:VWFA-related protein